MRRTSVVDWFLLNVYGAGDARETERQLREVLARQGLRLRRALDREGNLILVVALPVPGSVAQLAGYVQTAGLMGYVVPYAGTPELT